jgi:phospholipid transport system substrate-binding protein
MRARWYAVVTLVVGFGLIAAQPAAAATPTEVLEAFYAHANAILRTVDPLGDLEQPRQAIRDLVNDVFDFRGAAALALGPAWLSRTPEDQAEFVRLFGVFLERGFIGMIASKASLADGVKIAYFGESITGQAAGVATTLLTRNGLELPVDYWFVRRGESWKVQDVVIDGVSLVANYRAQFARVLGAYPYAEIIARMGGNPPEAAPNLAAVASEAQKPVVAAIPGRAQGPGTVLAAAPSVQSTVSTAPQPATPLMTATAPPAPKPSPSPMMQPASPPAPPAAAILAPWTRQEIHLASLPREQRPAERPRVSLEAERPSVVATVARPEPAGEGQAAGSYWVQLGAFQSVDAAGHLADRYRRDGATISQFWLTNASGNRVGVLVRVRLGPFANRSDALSKVKELTARGQTSFIAGARD